MSDSLYAWIWCRPPRTKPWCFGGNGGRRGRREVDINKTNRWAMELVLPSYRRRLNRAGLTSELSVLIHKICCRPLKCYFTKVGGNTCEYYHRYPNTIVKFNICWNLNKANKVPYVLSSFLICASSLVKRGTCCNLFAHYFTILSPFSSSLHFEVK